ncbi:zinc ribbon domain-containing protein [Defluviitalea phaphyphila]|uniref:zinc ribbon domain-containing protein n=1 Tax=Defluviitalea phaphyphila TaxID=1473580 RepID=UPI000730AE3F|nr:zinc ribbon domain-containing protein [Defluviitalea phaphyphila]
MFFIGIFGIEQKQKEISIKKNTICPVCEALGNYRLIKSYNYFHIFFIPIFKWNIQYYITTSCCKKMVEINEEVARKIENGENVEIDNKDVKMLYNNVQKFCPNCGLELNTDFKFCPYCGHPIL